MRRPVLPSNRCTSDMSGRMRMVSPGPAVMRSRKVQWIGVSPSRAMTWVSDPVGSTKTLDMHVSWLRRKLGDPPLIETVKGAGYRI